MNLFLRKTEDRSKPNRRDFLVQSAAASLGIAYTIRLGDKALAQGARRRQNRRGGGYFQLSAE